MTDFEDHAEKNHGSPKAPDVYKIELWLETYMWNEGFEKAKDPWLELYTTNGHWAKNLPNKYTTYDSDSIPQDFRVEAKKVKGKKKHRLTAIDGTDAQLDTLIQERILEWTGV